MISINIHIFRVHELKDSIVKISIVPPYIYKLSATQKNIQQDIDVDRLILQLTWKDIKPKIANMILKNKVGRFHIKIQ